MKVNSTVYKGIEFIEISTLPNEQKESVLQTVNPELLIKILIDGKLVPRCLQYKDYEEWYDNSFLPLLSENASKAMVTSYTEKVEADFQV